MDRSRQNAAVFDDVCSPKEEIARHTIWIDLENSPHVPFFLPIIREMEARGCEVLLTARDCFQVCELADMVGLKYRKVGRHYGKNSFAKLMGLAIRVSQLASLVYKKRPGIAVSHCSRSLIALCALLGIPNVNIIDYEFSNQLLTSILGSKRKKWVLTPEVIPSGNFEKAGLLKDHILHYPGIKEDVYVPFFQPDPLVPAALGISSDDIVVTLRPPATEAHYHNPESEKLLMTVFELLENQPNAKTILLPRTPKQEAELRRAKPKLFSDGRIKVPEHVVNGLDLIWHSDVVISGGGTMNREAAALGVPVYSFFRGTLGAVDAHLAQIGKLILLETEQNVREKLKLVRREKTDASAEGRSAALDAVIDSIFAVLQ
jgi:predicted glycosyltransferase